MKYAKFKRIFANLTAQAAKVYMSTDDEPLSIAEINKRVQSSEHGGPRVFSAVEGCAYSLARCGLLIENPRGVFRRVPVDDQSAPGDFDDSIDTPALEALSEPDDARAPQPAPKEPEMILPKFDVVPADPLPVSTGDAKPQPRGKKEVETVKAASVVELIKATSAKVASVRAELDEIDNLLLDLTHAALRDVDAVATAKAEVKRLDKLRALAAQLKDL